MFGCGGSELGDKETGFTGGVSPAPPRPAPKQAKQAEMAMMERGGAGGGEVARPHYDRHDTGGMGLATTRETQFKLF